MKKGAAGEGGCDSGAGERRAGSLPQTPQTPHRDQSGGKETPGAAAQGCWSLPGAAAPLPHGFLVNDYSISSLTFLF